MKKIFAIFCVIVFVTACDSPREQRRVLDTTGQQTTTTTAYSVAGKSNSTDSSKVNTNPDIPSAASHCSFSDDGITGFQSLHNHLGKYTICQSRADDKDIYFQLETPIKDVQLCFIPMFDNGKKAIYIGEPRCIGPNIKSKIYNVKMLKNRKNFEEYKLTGLMVLKDKAFFYPAPFSQYILSPDAFIFCSQWLDQTGDQSYCESFNSKKQFIYNSFNKS